MNTMMRPHESVLGNRPSVQRICILVGLGFIFFGLTGVLHPGFIGLHLSAAHNLIHLSCGSMILLAGFAEEKKKAYILSSSLGFIFGLLGFLGYVLGRPGFPAVGDMNSDLHLWRLAPDFLEFASSDHIFHSCISFLLLLGAFSWKISQDQALRSIIDVQRRG
jgi:hypothetical protein